MSVSNRAQISSSWCQSRQERASRDIATPSTRPTRPSPTSATSRWNPGRTSAEAPERPRSSSMTTTRSRAQPSWPARSARAYWSRVDCRTWTTASRSRWRPPIFSGRVGGAIGTLLARRLSRRRRAGGIEPAPGHPADQDRQPAASVDRQPAPDRGERCRGRHGDVAAAIGPARAGRCGPRAAARSTASPLQTFRRGSMENLIKAHKVHLASDRTSCSKATANQFRLVLHTAAYWLVHTLRDLAPKRSFWREAQFDTIRFALVKVVGRVTELASRIELALPSAHPYRDSLTLLAARAARPPLSRGAACPDRARPRNRPAPIIAPPAPRVDAPSITAGRSRRRPGEFSRRAPGDRRE